MVIQKMVLPRLTAVWSKLSKRLIYDIDDGVFVYYPEINRILHLYDAVVTGAHWKNTSGSLTCAP
jgi:hypothetical protein